MKRLKELRKEKRVTLGEVAEATGISFQAISFYEHGERDASVKSLIKLADYFNVSLDYLVGRSDKR